MINHKGTECEYKPITCVEGWCEGCQVYLDYQGHLSTMGRSEICTRCSVDRVAVREMIAQGGRHNLTLVNTILENCPACKRAIGGVG